MIYADYNGSAPLHPKVRDYMCDRLKSGPYANPNAIHSVGKKMLFGMEKCRRICASVLGCSTDQIIFNSGASEGISQIFFSELNERKDGKNVIITSEIEHSAVVNACAYYNERGFEVIHVKTRPCGQIDLEDFENKLNHHKNKIALVCIMAANNETGVIQPWTEIAGLCEQNGATFFSDTTQYIGKIDFDFEQSKMDYAVLSGHKIGALVGSGLIIAKDPTRLRPMIFGGGQERGQRGGTQNYIGIESLAIALEAFSNGKEGLSKLKEHRLAFEAEVKAAFPKVVIIGEEAPRLATTTLISLPGVHGQAVQIELESQDIFVTTSSACSDNEPETSKVLKAMNIEDDIGRGVVRISLCCGRTKADYDAIASALKKSYSKLSGISSY